MKLIGDKQDIISCECCDRYIYTKPSLEKLMQGTGAKVEMNNLHAKVISGLRNMCKKL